MNKSKIEWCDYTWNPVTGCLHGCPYCYAERIAKRFAPLEYECGNCRICPDCPGKTNGKECPEFRAYMQSNKLHILENKQYYFYPKKRYIAFPYGFEPTLHRYRMQEPESIKGPATIFVCSMADLFGAWIPDEWILEVFKVCAKYKQHRYMFLTKNPGRYKELAEAGLLPTDDNMFYGTTITDDETEFFFSDKHKTFLSVEPIQKEFSERKLPPPVDWVIIGQETGNRKDKIIADAGWIEKIYNVCHSAGIPVFMKNNLSGIVENLRQESAT